MSEHSGHYCIVMYKCKVGVFMTILYTCSPMPHSSGSQPHVLSVTGSELSSLSLPFPSAASLKGAVGYEGDAGGVGCFSTTGAESNAICFFLFKE